MKVLLILIRLILFRLMLVCCSVWRIVCCGLMFINWGLMLMLVLVRICVNGWMFLCLLIVWLFSSIIVVLLLIFEVLLVVIILLVNNVGKCVRVVRLVCGCGCLLCFISCVLFLCLVCIFIGRILLRKKFFFSVVW